LNVIREFDRCVTLGIERFFSQKVVSLLREITCIVFVCLFVCLFNATFNNISVISWPLVLLMEETGVPG